MEEEFQGSKVLRRGSGAGGMWGWGVGIVGRRRSEGGGSSWEGRGEAGVSGNPADGEKTLSEDEVATLHACRLTRLAASDAHDRLRVPDVACRREDRDDGQCRTQFEARW